MVIIPGMCVSNTISETCKWYPSLLSSIIFYQIFSDMSVVDVSIFSISGMGFRCDFCNGSGFCCLIGLIMSICCSNYLSRGVGKYRLILSKVIIKPGTVRPMSITADAVHFMHFSGHIEVTDSIFAGQVLQT